MTNTKQAEMISALRSAKVALSFCGKSAQARALSADARRKIDAALAKVEDDDVLDEVVADALSIIRAA
jgi:hypothetical protein